MHPILHAGNELKRTRNYYYVLLARDLKGVDAQHLFVDTRPKVNTTLGPLSSLLYRTVAIMQKTMMQEPWDRQIPPMPPPTEDEEGTRRGSYSTARTTVDERDRLPDRWIDQASPTTKSPSPYKRKGSLRKKLQFSLVS